VGDHSLSIRYDSEISSKTGINEGFLMLRKLLLCFASALLFAVVGHSAYGTEPKELPEPTDYVSDFAHVLTAQTIDEIDHACDQLDHSTADTQIAVVTIPSLDGADIAQYATELGNAWGVGGKGSHRGVIVLLAVDDHQWRIAINHQSQAILPNSIGERIAEKMVPLLQAGDFDGAVKLAVHEIVEAARVPASPAPDRSVA
jgi:uncharacterized protein